MSYHELTRRELQTLCKQNGLPANKSNAVMASSLTSFFSDQQTITRAYAHVVTPSAATKSIKTRALPKPETLETSLASLILAARKIPAKSVEDILLKSNKDLNRPRVSSPADFADFTPLPNSTPLRRRRKKSDAITTFPTAAEDATSKDIAQVQYTSRPVVKEISTPELQLAPHLNADVQVKDKQSPPNTRGPERHGVLASRTGVGVVMKKEVQLSSPSESEPVASSYFHEQDCQNNFDPGHLQPVLMSPLLRITADVDMLIRRATGMLEKFEQWKVENPNKNTVHGSGQMHLSLDKENLFQQSPYKYSKTRSLQGYTSCDAQQLDGKEGILKDIDLNAHA